MPNELHELHVDEVSLVDVPANSSIDPKTGRRRRHAVVALFKFDASGDEQDRTDKRGEPTMKFEEVLKSATTRDQIVAAVRQEAVEIAKRGGITVDAAEAQ